MGKCTAELRLPLTPMAEGNLQKLKQGMVEFGLVKNSHAIAKANEN
jgi:hypothetical protein